MDKSKRKGKPKRRRLIILVLLIVLSGCVLTGIYIFDGITNPRYEIPIFADIPFGTSDLLARVETRLLEYVTIGESTQAEVEAFGDEHLSFTGYSCPIIDETPEPCYPVNVSMWFCSYYIMEIIFLFDDDDVLNDIEFDYHAGCL